MNSEHQQPRHEVLQVKNGITYTLYEKGMFFAEPIADFLRRVDDSFRPPLSKTINLDEWAQKLQRLAHIIAATDGDKIVGLNAFYFNEAPEYSYGTLNAVLKEYRSQFVGPTMDSLASKYEYEHHSAGCRFEIRASNKAMVRVQLRYGSVIEKEFFNEETNERRYIMSYTFPVSSPGSQNPPEGTEPQA